MNCMYIQQLVHKLVIVYTVTEVMVNPVVDLL